jgi:hypothetical protein
VYDDAVNGGDFLSFCATRALGMAKVIIEKRAAIRFNDIEVIAFAEF